MPHHDCSSFCCCRLLEVFPIRRLLTLLLLLWIAVLTGCASSNSSILRMDLQSSIHNLDPQFTTEEAAQMILLNLGEGLMIWMARG